MKGFGLYHKWLHLTMHRTFGLTDYYQTISGELTGLMD